MTLPVPGRVNSDEAPYAVRRERYDLDGLRETGLLWLINTAVLHPRGFGMALHYDEDGACLGWSLQGDGGEPWTFADSDPGVDEAFAAVTRFLRPAGAEPGS